MEPRLIEYAPGFSAYAGSEEETRFFYNEIFRDHAYDVAHLPDDAFIIDAGANVGMFTLYMKKKYPRSTILAFEPVPDTFQILSKNVDFHRLEGVTLHECALSSETATTKLTFYPTCPGNSTLVPEEKEIVKTLSHKVSETYAKGMEMAYQNPKTIMVKVDRLSHFLQDCGVIKCIDLLKVDVEGVEIETLEGLDEAHWALVRNIVVEICDLREGRLDGLMTLLRSKGFKLKVESPSWSPEEGRMFMVVGNRDNTVL